MEHAAIAYAMTGKSARRPAGRRGFGVPQSRRCGALTRAALRRRVTAESLWRAETPPPACSLGHLTVATFRRYGFACAPSHHLMTPPHARRHSPLIELC